MTAAREQTPSRLDRLARLDLSLRGRSLSSFTACGAVGFALALAVASGLAATRGLSVAVTLLLAALAAIVFLSLEALGRRDGEPAQLSLYHHQLAMIGAAVAALWLSGEPVLSYLDVILPATGVFLACGRVGCLMVGCCHGRPARVGIRYSQAHVRAGFTAYLAGERLFPIQAVEAAWLLCVVAVSVAASAAGPPGAGAVWYLAGYAVGRFFIEYARGDGPRPYLLGLSEAQWTSALLLVALVGIERAGLAPWSPAQAIAALALACVAVATVAGHRARGGRESALLEPRHLDEIAWTVGHLSRRAVETASQASGGSTPRGLHVAATSRGLSISASCVVRDDGALHHYALSRAEGLGRETAAQLGRVICALTGDHPEPTPISRVDEIFHLVLFHPRRPA